ncbi:glycoside hydrolase family 55 protein (plasmid) [Cupriavidus pinatubonensis]|uniref:glycoside hydrolase family 55 protein n=1 Tax=Cupriavidus pinatubonensis TaxID=248026 RepID=UPI001C73027D|nr:glycoside hydrolase family 55 protein [Cupriavidus pinatubonensis]QYY34184.1 glycoside hydrolase family 55 protein [Cupriavidus pinatubonensis]
MMNRMRRAIVTRWSGATLGATTLGPFLRIVDSKANELVGSRQSVSVFDFMSESQRTAVVNFDFGVDQLRAIERAQDYLQAMGGGQVYFPYGGYGITEPIINRANISLVGNERLPTLKNVNKEYSFRMSSIFSPGNFHPEYVGKLRPIPCDRIKVGNFVILQKSHDAAALIQDDCVIIMSDEYYMSSEFKIQKYIFLNEIVSVDGNLVQLKYSMDREFEGGIVRLDGTQIGRDGVPLFFWRNGEIRNFRVHTNGFYISDSATLNCRFDNIRIDSAKYGIYGNAYQRTVFSNISGKVADGVGETSLCSLMTRIENFKFEMSKGSGDRPQTGISIQENGRKIVYSNGKVDFGSVRLGAALINYINAEECSVLGLELAHRGAHENAVVQYSDATRAGRVACANNTTQVQYDGVRCARYYSFSGSDDPNNVVGNKIMESKFVGTVSSGECGRMVAVQGKNTIRQCDFGDGKPLFGGTVKNQEFEDSYLAVNRKLELPRELFKRNVIRGIRSHTGLQLAG